MLTSRPATKINTNYSLFTTTGVLTVGSNNRNRYNTVACT